MASRTAAENPITHVAVEKKLDASVRSKIEGDVFLHVQVDDLSNVGTGGKLPSFQLDMSVRGAKTQTDVVPKKSNAEFRQRFTFAFPNGIGGDDVLQLALVDTAPSKNVSFGTATVPLDKLRPNFCYDFATNRKISLIKDQLSRAALEATFAITADSKFPTWSEMTLATPRAGTKKSPPRPAGALANGGPQAGRQRSGTFQRLKRSMSVRFGKGDGAATPFLGERSNSLSGASPGSQQQQGKRRNSLFGRLRSGSRPSLTSGGGSHASNGSPAWELQRSNSVMMGPPVAEQASRGNWSANFSCDCGHAFEHRVTFVTHIKYCQWHGRKSELEKAKEEYEALKKASPEEAAAMFAKPAAAGATVAAAGASAAPAAASSPASKPAAAKPSLSIDATPPPPQLSSGNYDRNYTCDCGHTFQFSVSFKTHVAQCKFFTGDRRTPFASKAKKDDQRLKQSLLQPGTSSDGNQLPPTPKKLPTATDEPKPPVNPKPAAAVIAPVVAAAASVAAPTTNGAVAPSSDVAPTTADSGNAKKSAKKTAAPAETPESTPEAGSDNLKTKSKKKRKKRSKKKGKSGNAGAAVV